MCGRFALKVSQQALVAALKQLFLRYELDKPRYNIAPTQIVPVVRAADGAFDQRELVPMRWGLIPSWAKDPAIGSTLINARGETVAEKPAFRQAFKSRRCVIPADGFYEWKKLAGKRKQPYYIYLADGSLMFFAGLWEQWVNKDTGECIETCAIVTTEANDAVADLHNRMPVVLRERDIDTWLSPNSDHETLRSLLKPAPAEWFARHPVSDRVNSPRHTDASLLEPVPALPETENDDGMLF